MEPTRDEILRRTRFALRTAEFGLEEMQSEDPQRAAAGIHNVLVWGRAVTNVLQQLRGRADGFEEWYTSWREEMEADRLLKFLYKARSQILKEGGVPTTVTVHIRRFRVPEDVPPVPPGAKSFFMGDETGGSGWIIDAGGVQEKVYTELPTSQVKTWLGFVDVPDTHLGNPIEDQSLEGVARLYVEYLQRLVADAERAFGESAAL